MDPLTEHLRTLGLSPNTTLKEALAAHRDLVRVWHPDRFESDPKLRAKAQEQTVRLNLAIEGVREALKNPRPSSAPPRRPSNTSHLTPPTLIIHQPTRTTIIQAIFGCAILCLGIFLVVHFSVRDSPQTALGLVLTGYGFSMLLFAFALLCFKTPIIAINRAFLHILGIPRIPIFQVRGANVLISQRGTSLTISCSPEYVRTLPVASRLSMRLRHLVRGYHFEFHSSIMDSHPTHVIETLSAVAQLASPTQAPSPKMWVWGIHANTIATACLTVAVVRCLVTSEHHLIALIPYLLLFALFRSVAILQTAVLAHPARHPYPH
jgi:hypothetical protein